MTSSQTEGTGGRRFVLVRTLGEGTFGAVFLADMEGAGGFRRKVALKILHSNWDPSGDAGRRLRDEARLLGRLQHRHIVRVDDLVRLEGKWALMMEYIGGSDLEKVFDRAKHVSTFLSPRAVADIGVAVASALDSAWNALSDDGQPLRVIHRDIKPSNVRVSETGDIKVLDFGVARADFTGREAKTERVRYGSLGYMAPERVLGDEEIPAGDIYALGVLLWELFTLETFGRAELGPEPQKEQVSRARAALIERVPDERLGDLVARCLDYDASARPSAPDLEAELRRIARDLPGDDVVGFARAWLTATRAEEPDPVQGTVMEEHATGELRNSDPRASNPRHVNSATLSIPDFDLPDAAAPVPAKAGLPVTAIASVVAALGVLVGLGWMMSRPEPAGGAMPRGDASAMPGDAPLGAQAPARGSPPIASPATQAPPGLSDVRPGREPEPVAPLAPVVVAPVAAAAATPATAPKKAAPRVALVAAAAPPPPEAARVDGPRLRAAKFTLTGAEGIRVTCGGVTASGATSALLRDFPAGTCAVTAGSLSTTVTVDTPRGVGCAVDGATLTCR